MAVYFAKAHFFYIFTVTNCHVGSGSTASEEIDLPFQRDSLGYPTIYASSLKGSIKSFLLRTYEDSKKGDVFYLFGKDESADEASKVSILDAVLLLIPARIISVSNGFSGVYAYATTVELLDTAKSYLDAVFSLTQGNLDGKNDDVKFYKVDENGNLEVIVNESYFKFKENDDLKNNYSRLIPPSVNKPILVFEGNIGKDIINRSLIRVRRIRIDRSKKTVEIGGLWSEEYVPHDTYFMSVALVREDGKKDGGSQSTLELFNSIKNKLNYLVIGGHETIGKGIVRLIWAD
jgi:CRISPR-associated protein Cmr4